MGWLAGVGGRDIAIDRQEDVRKPPKGGGPTQPPPTPSAAALSAANTLGTGPSAWSFDGVQSHQPSGPSSLLVDPPTFSLDGEEGDDMYEAMGRGPLIDLIAIH